MNVNESAAENTKLHSNTVEFQVTGDLALFSDPVTRTGGEKSSYPIPTYEALKGIMHSIYFKPTLIWYVDDVRIMNPIRTETKGILVPLYNEDKNDLSYYTYLTNVCYQVRCHFEWNLNRPEFAQDRNSKKHLEIARRSIERGGRRDVFLGTRECQAYVESCKFGTGPGAYDTLETDLPFGNMYMGITYADEAVNSEDKGKWTLRMFTPVMQAARNGVGGIIHFPKPDSIKQRKIIRENAPVKSFGNSNQQDDKVINTPKLQRKSEEGDE